VKVVEIREGFGLDHLVACERPDPTVQPGQVVLRMRAASLNYRDLLMVRGHYDPKQRLPLIPGSDGVGEVVAVGEGVKRVRSGDRVCPIFAQRWISGQPTRDRLRSTLGGPLDGTFAEQIALDAEGVVRVPEYLTDDEAATLPCAGVTAFNAVVRHGAVRVGQTVLVQGTGGVSTFALQLATLLGARVIVTSSSDEKLERARALGAWKTINYHRDPNWGREARALTDGQGVDLVVEVGGAGTFEQSVSALRFGGRIALIGTLAGGKSEINLIPVFMRQIRVQGVLVGSREDFEALNRAIEAHRMRPPVSRIFPLDEPRAALEHVADRGHFGKVCLRIA
jgi:2-desacetyl-2-hydroxyethyl bacteriochlorophyllide A dehydrogenase